MIMTKHSCIAVVWSSAIYLAQLQLIIKTYNFRNTCYLKGRVVSGTKTLSAFRML